MNELTTRCCVAGGGPAGMMLGTLLARAGIDVIVLEKHADFFRDFRGDTIHPSTLELMAELGWDADFLARPHQRLSRLRGLAGDTPVTIADLTHLPVRHPFIAMMPQWDFLDFLRGHAEEYPTFRLLMRAEVNDLIEEEGRVVGVRARTEAGEIAVRADLTVAADGRHSFVRGDAGLVVDDIGAPIDVLWMRLPKKPADTEAPLARFQRGGFLVTIDRGDYFQCAYVVPKGGIEAIKARGIEALRRDIANVAPALAERVEALKSFDDVKLLTVTIDRLREWAKPGLLVIGDAAHAMSPVGGVGVNLAVQDAVAAANLLWEPLRRGVPTLDELKAVQKRRSFPTWATQRRPAGADRRPRRPSAALPSRRRDPVAAAYSGAGARSRLSARAYSLS